MDLQQVLSGLCRRRKAGTNLRRDVLANESERVTATRAAAGCGRDDLTRWLVQSLYTAYYLRA